MRTLLPLFLGFSLTASAAEPELAGTKPNIILIMPDDQGYGDLACHGNPHIRTPNLDRLHRESVRFTDFHVSPTCAPTRAALMTGRHEFKNGVTHTINERERLTLKAVTLPQLLKQAGYTTGIFGKWHLGDEDDYQPGKRGFDEVFIHGAGGIGQTYPGSCGDAPGNKYFDPVLRHNGTFVKTTGYCTDVFFSHAMKWIEATKGKQPFFAYITPNAPHFPLDCPVGSDKPYLGKVPPNVAKFYGMIENIDANIGALLDMLKARNIERQTLVIFLTDNGTATGANVYNAGMRGAKGTPFLGGTRVPSFWRWPGPLPSGVDVNALTCHYDILPTLVTIAGGKLEAVAEQVEGRNLLPLLLNGNAPWANRTFITHVGRWPKGEAAKSQFARASIRDERFQLVFLSDKNWQLFDLTTDPGTTNNILKEHPEVVKRLLAVYEAWWQSLPPLLVNEDAIGPKHNPYHTAYWAQFRGPGPNNVAPPTP